MLRRGLLVLVFLAQSAGGQIIDFKPPHVLDSRSLEILQTFFVYSKEEAPSHDSTGYPFIKFHNIEATRAVGKGYEIVMMSTDHFTKYFDSTSFCCDDGMIAGKQCGEDARGSFVIGGPEVLRKHIYRYPVPSFGHTDQTVESRQPLLESGAYVLVLANCGPTKDAELTGRILVKNPFGFLPGDEIHKLRFYMQLTCAYVLVAMAWSYQAFKWWTELVFYQYVVSAIIFLGLLDTSFSYFYYNDWNESGTPSSILFCISSFFGVAKSMSTVVFVLFAALGLGITRARLDTEVTNLLMFFGIWFIVHIVFAYSSSANSRNHYGSSAMKMYTNAFFACAALQSSAIIWIMTSLTELIESLKSRRQTEKLLLFQRLFVVLGIVAVIACLLVCAFIYRVNRLDAGSRWRDEWLFVDAAPAGGIFVILVGLAYLWAPSQYSKVFEFASVSKDEEFRGSAPPGVPVGSQDVWGQEDSDEDEDLEKDGGGTTFWEMTQTDSTSPFGDDVLVNRAEETLAQPSIGGVEIINGALVVDPSVAPAAAKVE